MACDFSVAGDHARFGQAGPVHGSAPDGGATDFLHLYVGVARAAESLVLCEPWSAQKAQRYGLLNGVVPVYRAPNGDLIDNPIVDAAGEWKTGPALEQAKQRVAECTIDLGELDLQVDRLVVKLTNTFPDCTRRTLESLRKKKLEHWFANMESSRSWLSLNMATEAAAGFPAFHFGDRNEREIDFALLRRRIAEGARFDDKLVAEVLKPSARTGWEKSR